MMVTWIKAREVIERAGHDPATARGSPLVNAIKLRASVGGVRTKADRYSLDGLPCAKGGECPLDQQFWKTGSAYMRDNWASGDFTTQVHSRDAVALGVSFALEDVEPLIKAHAAPVEVAESKPLGKAGRKLSAAWPLFVAELALWLYEGGDFVGLTPDKLLGLINGRLAEKGVDEMPRATAQATLTAVLSALGEASLAE